MFKSKFRRPLHIRMGRALWPRTGWRRASTYMAHRVGRLPGSAYSIAAGFACGAAISFTPFLGFHFVFAVALAWLLGGNLIASALGTVVGNPWTFPVIWLTSYRMGRFLLGEEAAALPRQLSMTFIFDNPAAVLLPMAIGGVILAVVAWFVFFWVVRRMVSRYQAMRRARIRKRDRRLRREHGVETEIAE